ncbi:MAG: Hsp20/alpha crystallin family protein, partial [Gemmataceae bacterium]
MRTCSVETDQGSVCRTASSSSNSVVVPRADVMETPLGFDVRLELPGVPRDAVTIEYANSALTIRAERAATGIPAGAVRALAEYEVTKYQRTFRVTNTIAADKIQAQMEQGVLTLHLPKI